MNDDAELLRRYAETRSDEAFAELVRRHLGMVYGAAQRRLAGDAHRAADVAQQVFTALARDAGRLAGRPVLDGWLYATTRNVAIDVIRAEKRRREREQEAHAMDELGSQETTPDWEKMRPVLDSAMDRLNRAEREVILLRFFAARPFREIGAALTISEDAARMRVERALEKLRAALGRSGVTSTAAALATVLAEQGVSAAPAGLAPAISASAAGVIVAPASVAGDLLLMITTHKAVTLAGVVALVALGTASRQAYMAHAAGADAGFEQEILSREVQQLNAARARQTAVETELASARAATVPPPDSGGASADATGRKRATSAARSSGAVASEEEDPAALAVWTVERTKAQLHFTAEWRRIAARAFPFLPRLALAPAQTAAYTALAERELDDERFRSWGRDPELTVEAYPARLEKEWAEKTRALLGDAAFEQLDRLVAAQGQVVTLANYASRLEIPLTQDQSTRMLALLAVPEARLSDGRTDWPYVYAQAEGILTSAQLAAWRRYHDLDQFQQELNDAYRKAELSRADGAPRR